MAEIVGAVAGLLGPVIELGNCVAKPIKRQFNYLCCFDSNKDDLRREAKRLKYTSEGLVMRVDRARNNAEVIVPEVNNWLENAKEFQTNMTEIESEIRSIQSGFLAVKSRYLLSRKVKKTTEAMEQHRHCCDFKTISRPAELAAVASTPLGSIHELESRKHVEEEIMTTLKDNKVNIMGMCGMGGVGKTTMAKKIMNRVRDEHLFDEAIMTVVSQSVDKFKIQGEMAEQLGLELKETSSSSRAHKLHERLKGEKRILVVLDDVWKDFKLEELIGIPCQSGFEGCKILLTSRNMDVLTKMDVELILKMETLSEKEAWSLFQEKVGTCVNDQNLISIAKEVVDQCQGLPVALVGVAGALKNQKEKSIWKDTLEQLKSSNPIDLSDILEKVYIPLKVSFDLLRSRHAEYIFLLCCLFPEDYDIPLEDLTIYAKGLCLFEDVRNLEQVRNRTHSVVDRLKSRFLLLEGANEYHVRMHDVVRDVAIYIASSEDRQLIKCGDNCTWISPFLEERIGLSNGTTFPKLRLLLIDESNESVDEELVDESVDEELVDESVDEELKINFEGMKELNVLSMRYSSLGSFPHTTRLLKNLQTLHLDSCRFLKTISVVGELENLEILICRNCRSIKELPKEMRRLRSLRLLEISSCRKLNKIAPGVISKLDKLEELKVVESFADWEAEDNNNEGKGRENAGLRELESLSNLRCLEIEIWNFALAAEPIHLSGKLEKFYIKLGGGDMWDDMDDRPEGFDKILRLELWGEASLGCWIDMQLLSNAEYLESFGDGSNNLDLAKAQNLRSLSLEGCKTMKKLVNITSSNGTNTVFPRLESLVLEGLSTLEECPIPDQGSSDSFRNLKKLWLSYLPELRHLFRSPYQHHVISNLSSIYICGCHSLRNTFLLATAKDFL